MAQLVEYWASNRKVVAGLRHWEIA